VIEFQFCLKSQISVNKVSGYKLGRFFRSCDGLIVGAVMVLLQKYVRVYCRGSDAAISETVMRLLYKQ